MEITVTADNHDHTMVLKDNGAEVVCLIDLDDAGKPAFELRMPGAALKLLVEQAELNAKMVRLAMAMQQEAQAALARSGLVVAQADLPKDLKG
jgi:hypothetical protein